LYACRSYGWCVLSGQTLLICVVIAAAPLWLVSYSSLPFITCLFFISRWRAFYRSERQNRNYNSRSRRAERFSRLIELIIPRERATVSALLWEFLLQSAPPLAVFYVRAPTLRGMSYVEHLSHLPFCTGLFAFGVAAQLSWATRACTGRKPMKCGALLPRTGFLSDGVTELLRWTIE